MEVETIFTFLVSIISVITAILGTLLLFQIMKNKKGYIQNKMLIVFGLFALSFIFWAIADLLWSILPFFEIEPAFGFPEYFYIAGYLLGIISFSYFIKLCLKDSTFTDLIPFIFFGIFLIGATVFSLKFFIISSEEFSFFEFLLAYLYPICSGVMLVLSSSVYSFFSKVGDLKKPLFFIAIGFLFCYLGDLAYTYISLREIYGWSGIFSDSVYIIQYILTSFAFYSLYTKLKNKTVRK